VIGSVESESKLWILVLTRFLHASRQPLRSRTLWRMIARLWSRSLWSSSQRSRMPWA